MRYSVPLEPLSLFIRFFPTPNQPFLSAHYTTRRTASDRSRGGGRGGRRTIVPSSRGAWGGRGLQRGTERGQQRNGYEQRVERECQMYSVVKEGRGTYILRWVEEQTGCREVWKM